MLALTRTYVRARSWVKPVMSKRYEEPGDVEAPEGAIEAFWWRGKRYYVRQVLCRWREASGWWEPTGDGGSGGLKERSGSPPVERVQPWARGDAREIWRVDAQPETNG